jgi:hypothetical protein
MSPTITPDGRHNPPAAAHLLHCSVAWLAEQRAKGAGPTWYKVAGKVWYDHADLVAYLQEQREKSRCHSTRDAAAERSPSATTTSTRGTTASRSTAADTITARARQIAERRLSKSVANARKSKPPALLPLPGGR